MKINFDTKIDHLYNQQLTSHSQMLQGRGKMDKKEKIARKELLRVWTWLFEEFANPGAVFPPMHEIRAILEREGVYAATEAISKKYWYLPRSKIEKEVRKHVRKGLANSELEEFIKEVKRAQTNPSLLPGLRNSIHNYIMNGF